MTVITAVSSNMVKQMQRICIHFGNQ